MNRCPTIYTPILAALCLVGCGDNSVNLTDTTGATTEPSTASETIEGTSSSTQGESSTTQGSTTEEPTTEEPTTEEPTTQEPTTGFPTETIDPCAFAYCPTDLPTPWQCSTYEEDCKQGEKCMPYANDGGSSWNALQCVEVTGSGKHGDPCTVQGSGVSGIDDCDLHHMCWDVDSETNMGHCIAFCDGSPEDPSCAPPNTVCVIANDDTLNLCLPSCDPLLQACPESEGCYPINTSYVCAPNAAPDDSGFEGDQCNYINACQPGFTCTEDDQLVDCMHNRCCTPFCDLNVQDSCPNPETICRPIYGDNQEYPDAGFCGLPICDPLLQTGCPEGQGCYPGEDNYSCEDMLAPEDTGFEGDPCSVPNHCQLGFTCVVPEQLLNCEDYRCCTPFCDLNEPDACPNPETQCIAVYEDNIDYPNVGFCGAP